MRVTNVLKLAAMVAASGLCTSAFGQCPELQIGATPNAPELGVTPIGNSCDDCVTSIPLPFAVGLYGGSFTQAVISSNGTIQFATNSSSFGNGCPLPRTPFLGGPTIFPHWDDLRTDQTGGSGRGVFVSTTGVEGSRRFNIEYRAVLYRANTQPVNFVVSFYENQSFFDVFYINISEAGVSATAGVQADALAGSSQTTLSCNGPNLISGTSFRYSCPSTFGPSVTLALSEGSALIGQSFVAEATVATGLPASSITGVLLNANAVDAGLVTLLDDGIAPDAAPADGVYSGNVLIGPGALIGFRTVTAIATDELGRTGQDGERIEVLPLPPTNDTCDSPIEVFDGSNLISNLGATSDGSSSSCGPSDGVEVYFSYTATASGPLQIDLCEGLSFDSTLTISEGCAGPEVACSDSSECGSPAIIFDAVQGQTYIIRLADFFGSSTGDGTLIIGPPSLGGIDAFGFASPDPVTAGESTLLEVYVTPASNPPSTGMVVTIDTSVLQGGVPSQPMFDDGTNGDQFAGDNVYSFQQEIAPTEAEQTYELFFSIADDEGRTFDSSLFFDVNVSNPDAISATLTPPSGLVGTTVLLEVEVVPAIFPDSTGINVSADLSTLLGSPSQQLFDDGTNGDLVAGDNTFSFTFTIDPSLTPGPYAINVVSVTDEQGRVDDILPETSFAVRIPSQWDEIADGGGDAGPLLGSAQIPSGNGAFQALGGVVASGSDVDMFQIDLCDVGGFSATTVGTGTEFDTQLWLFDASGIGIVANDDSQGTRQSTLTSTYITSSGIHYIAINRYNVDAVNGAGQFMWTGGAESPPTGPGAPGPLGGWSGSGASGGEYQILMSGVCFAAGGPDCNYDYNQDENVDLLDAQQMAQVFVGLLTPESNWLDGDLNGDENADLTDAQILAAFVVSGNCNL